ncbi:alpha-amylase family glycosyl hydrolase, partial [Pseudomonas aeruginosa]
MLQSFQPPWWRRAVIYQVYPRSFADSNGDGVGDLPGLIARLDHLQRLGVDALWLSPVYRSPMRDAGYDICDHCDIDPLFGSLADLDRLLAEAHARGLRVLLDFVPNHTSDQHPWFLAARRGRDDPRRDWYIWRDQPNNWRAAIDGG